MRLRTKVFQLTLLTVVPTITFAIALATVLLHREREVQRVGAQDRNRAFMTAVDSEIRGHVLTLKALATSESLKSGALSKFHAEMTRVLASQPDWRSIQLGSTSREQVLNTSRPYGAKLPKIRDNVSFERALNGPDAAIGGVLALEITEGYGIPVRVPVVKNGRIQYVITAMLNLERFNQLVEAQRLFPSWIIGLVDKEGHLIARLPYRSSFELASEPFRTAVSQSTEGWYRATTTDGEDAYTAFKTSEYTGWSVGFGIPAAEVHVSAWRAIWMVGLGAVILVLLALPFSYWVSRHVSGPITDLLQMARSLGRQKLSSNSAVNSEIREVRELSQAFIDAAAAISERQKVIEQEKRALESADRAKDEFLAMLGHELRNPLSAVVNASALLSHPVLSVESRMAAQSVLMRQTAQLDRLVNDLLDVGRVVAGKIEIARTPLELGEVVDAAVQAFKATGRIGHRSVRIHRPEAVFTVGDFARMEQVVMNLVSNALAHTNENGAIEISVVKEKDFAVVCVADDGSGFGEEDYSTIFDLFYQVNSGSHRKGGLGMGLTLVKRLVELHGGSVTAFSAGRGKGATFTVRLPLANAITSIYSGKTQAVTPTRGLKILIIDDNDDVRISMRMLLESEGHSVSVAMDGRSGVDAAISLMPQIAIVDIGMPDMNGYDVARELRQRLGNDIFLIAMTGYGAPRDIKMAKEAGFDEHITKPASLTELQALLTTAAASMVPDAVPRSV
jgi:signal transduction histidine kinase/CheY-like chemotaxis protein